VLYIVYQVFWLIFFWIPLYKHQKKNNPEALDKMMQPYRVLYYELCGLAGFDPYDYY
jgi:hypothetical protein